MAKKRMFSLDIVDTDAFLEMPMSSQLLYFHLSLRADDDGFVGNPKKIMRMIGTQEDDMKVLIVKRFLLSFESGIIVIKHWKIHNYIAKDRYSETKYLTEKKLINTNENSSYTECIQNVDSDKIRLDKIRLDKIRREDGDKSPTPSKVMRDFIKNSEPTIQILVANNMSEDTARKEVNKFIDYWTELNKSGTRQRWEQQNTFEVKKRLITWFGKMDSFKGINKKGGVFEL